MKKYKNVKGTFVANVGKTKQWISLNSEAIVSEDSGVNVKIILKDLSKPISISRQIFEDFFVDAGQASSEDLYEFESDKNRLSKSEIVSLVKKHFHGQEQELFIIAIKKADQDAFTSAGSTQCLNIDEFEKHQSGLKNVNVLQEYGDPVFNRRVRWSPVADIQNWKKNYAPAPIGIRESDYASLKDCNSIFKELLCQVFQMDYTQPLNPEIEVFLQVNLTKGTHKCAYCGEKIDLAAFGTQAYKSLEQEINFCHRDPTSKTSRTRPGNTYFGHTDCNRIQGGLSELARIQDGLRLLELHRGDYLNDAEVQTRLSRLTA
jgi:hypothetical protein